MMRTRFMWIVVTISALATVPAGAANLLFVSDTTTDLALVNVVSSDSEFNIQNPPAPNTTLAPAQSYDLHVEFCPDSVGPRTGTLTIEHDAFNEINPITIDFAGNGI